MFNMQGQLIGIVNAKMFATGIEGLGFAIPLDTVQKKIDSIISEGNTGDKAVLGVVTQASVCYINNQKVDCVKITTVKENSAAEMAGLAVGDFLLSADGKTIRNNDDLVLIIKYSKPGDTLGFEVYRDNKTITVETTLGSSN